TVEIIVAYTTLWLLRGGAELVGTIGGRSTALDWPNAVKYAIVPAACVVSMAYLVVAAGTVRGMARALVALALAYVTLDPMQRVLEAVIGGASPSVLMAVGFALCLLIGVPVAFSMLFGVFIATRG